LIDRTLELVDERNWWERRGRRGDDRFGVGFAVLPESTGLTASRRVNRIAGLDSSSFDTAIVRLDSKGKLSVHSGQIEIGQGTTTALAQLAADELGLPLEDVVVVTGDTRTSPFTGYGTSASRGASAGGAAVVLASRKLRDDLCAVAARMLAVDPEDVELGRGRASCRQDPERFVTFEAIGDAAYRRLDGVWPEGIDPSLEARAVYDPTGGAQASGFVGVLVCVDERTGVARVVEIATAFDSGTVVNPLLVEGQIHGGASLGIGEALYESLTYQPDGQPMVTQLGDYLVPRAMESPSYHIAHVETPSAYGPHGMRGAGEAPTVATPAAVIAAIQDALGPDSELILAMPVLPSEIVKRLTRPLPTEDEHRLVSLTPGAALR
jgi:carbon-monoxide dehydrogenase large subunit